MNARIILLVALLIVVNFNGRADWVSTNGPGSRQFVWALVASGPNLFAGTDGGVYLSTNNGASWAELTGFANSDVRALAVSGTSLFAGTSGEGVFLSTNNGASWTAVNTGLTNHSVKAFTASGPNLFAGTDGGVYLSTNNGASWTAINAGLTDLHVCAIALSGTNLFAATSFEVFVSTNNGTNWIAASSGLPSAQVYSLVVSGANLFAGTTSGVYLSTNNGTGWAAVNGGLTDFSVFTLAVSGTSLFAGTTNGVYLSTNDGTNWTHINGGLGSRWVYSLAVTGTNLFAGTAFAGVYLSTNNGTNWAAASTGMWDFTISSFAVNGTNLFAGSFDEGGGAFLSTNDGTNWILINNGLNPFVHSFAISDANLFAGTEGGVYLSTNNGTSWTDPPLDLGTRIRALIADGSNLFAGIDGGVYLSTNNGASWTAVNAGIANTNVLSLALSGSNLFAGTEYNGVFLSTNNGTSWTAVNVGLMVAPVTSFALLGTNLFAGTFGGGGVSHSTNNGTTWTSVNGGLTDTLVLSLAASGTSLFAGTASTGVFVSTNNGISWTPVNAGLTYNNVQSLAVSGASLFAGTYRHGAWRRLLSEMVPPPFLWRSLIVVNDGCSGQDTLDFGQSSDATDGIDASLGEAILPPAPPAGVFDVRFVLPVIPSKSSWKDFRSDTLTSVVWKMTFQPGACGYPMSFSWDSLGLPEGRVFLRDEFGGSLVNVDMRSHSSYTLTNPAITSLKIEYVEGVCRDVIVQSGWNMVSTPAQLPSMAVQNLFPGALTQAFRFEQSVGYVSDTALATGKGYWVKFSSADTFGLCGTKVVSQNIPVSAGWNLIGSLEYEVQADSITSTPPGIIESSFYGFSSGYSIATTLTAGKGYWVSTTQAGTLHLPEGVLQRAYASEPTVQLAELIVEDAVGRIASVFFAATESDKYSVAPPLAPEGVMDVRFASNALVEQLKPGTHVMQLRSATYPIKVSVKNLGNSTLAIGSRKLDEGKWLTIPSGNGSFIVTVNAKSTLPTSYTLYQNYPNPFNPSTTIKFDIPLVSQVMLKVFDILGRELTTLVSEQRTPGRYEVEWNTKNAASGVYLYRLQAGNYTETRKMLLVR